jgi:hypothetical protein
MAESLLSAAPQDPSATPATPAPTGTPPEGQPQPKQETPGDKPPADHPGKPADPPKPEGAPETYKAFTIPKDMPEGYVLDETVAGAFSEVAKELNLTQDNAQKVIDKLVPVLHAQEQAKTEQAHQGWLKALKADTDLGGSHLDTTVAAMAKVVRTFGDSDLQALLSGPLGDHPAIARFLVRIEAGLKDAKLPGGGTPEKSPDSGLTQEQKAARKMYPNLAAKA